MKKTFAISGTGICTVDMFGNIEIDGQNIADQITKALGLDDDHFSYAFPGKVTICVEDLTEPLMIETEKDHEEKVCNENSAQL